MSKPDSLLLLSGGIDSVQALYARCVAGLATRTHFVRLKNWEGRAGAEARAVRDVLVWLSRKFPGLVGGALHSESEFDYGTIRYIVRDHNVWGLKAGILLADPKNTHLVKVIRTFHRDSVVGGLESAAGQAAERGWREPVARLAQHDVEFTYPQLEMTKADIIAGLPAELLALCWYCRRPKHGRPCHDCHTCKQVDAALAGEPLPPLDGAATPVVEAVGSGPVAAPESVSVTDLLDGPVTPDVDAVKRPNKAQSRAVWAEYAQSLGNDVEGLTKAQIIDLIEG